MASKSKSAGGNTKRASKPKAPRKPKAARKPKAPATPVYKNLANVALTQRLEPPAWAPEGAQVSYWLVCGKQAYLLELEGGAEYWAPTVAELEACVCT